MPVAMLLIWRVAWGLCSRMNLVWGNMHCKCLEMRDVLSAACPPRIQKKNHGERDHRCDKNVSLRIWLEKGMATHSSILAATPLPKKKNLGEGLYGSSLEFSSNFPISLKIQSILFFKIFSEGTETQILW